MATSRGAMEVGGRRWDGVNGENVEESDEKDGSEEKQIRGRRHLASD